MPKVMKIVGSKLDYCNRVLYGISQSNLDKLQRLQNVLAWVTAQAPWSVSATNLRRDLHWLPIRHRVIYKLSVLTYKALHTGQPYYLADLIDLYRPSRCLRYSNCHLLAVPSCAKSFASRAFCVSSPNNWNSLPLHIRSSDSLASFKSRLISHLFSSAYQLSRLVTHTPAPQIRFSTIGAI